ncbi:MAG: hypothetical protein KAQ98_05230 [Bacteriovoracaceae bacterium]|nr:hypothetical protein [Bacteriovoracaceae bacterium]
MKRLAIFIQLLVVFLVFSCSSTEDKGGVEQQYVKKVESTMPLGIQGFIEGWEKMIIHIQEQSADVSSLKGRTFSLRIKLDGRWQLYILPKKAFKIERAGKDNVVNVEIVRPQMLFENRGGLQKMIYIQAEIRKIGGDKGSIDLTADVECLFKVRFRQKNGKPVNFDKLLEAYEYDLVLTPSQYLDVYSINPEFVILKRKKFLEERATLRLLLVDKKNRETHYSAKVHIPQCGYKPKEPLPMKEKFHLIKKAGQCVHHIRTIGNRLDTTKVHRIFAGEVFFNICKHPVKCNLTAKYGYIKNKKIVEADTKIYKFSLEPESISKIDTSWNYVNQQFDFDSKLYIASTLTRETVPKDFKPEDQPGFLQCEWEE